jgi:hypothetical protein
MSKKPVNSGKLADLGITTLIWILCVAPVVLLGLLIAIIIKILSLPICTAVGQSSCSIDGWSLAGMAGTVLGIGAALLTILVGLAAIAWLAKLDQRIDERVEARVSERMEELRQKQEEALTKHFDEVFQKRWKPFEEAQIKTREEITTLNNQIDILLDIAMRPDLEDAEAFVDEWWDRNSRTRLAQNLVLQLIRRYRKMIDKLTSHTTSVHNVTVTPENMLAFAANWNEKLDALDHQVNPSGLDLSKQDKDLRSNVIIANGKIRKYTQIVKEWKTQPPDIVSTKP